MEIVANSSKDNNRHKSNNRLPSRSEILSERKRKMAITDDNSPIVENGTITPSSEGSTSHDRYNRTGSVEAERSSYDELGPFPTRQVGNGDHGHPRSSVHSTIRDRADSFISSLSKSYQGSCLDGVGVGTGAPTQRQPHRMRHLSAQINFHSTVPVPTKSKFDNRQWITAITFMIGNFFTAVCISLQAPFYPNEAEKKGVTASQYGLVFGFFELVVFLVSPLYGKYMNKIGPKFLLTAGMSVTSTCVILFGLLDKVRDGHQFIILSYLVRIIEGFGAAAFTTASFAIIAKEFPESMATTMAFLETFFGLGLIAGPTIGGALYELGGYTLPFAILGTALALACITTCSILPPQEDLQNEEGGHSPYEALKHYPLLIDGLTLFSSSLSIGFTSAILEPHVRQFNISALQTGLLFIISGGVYAITAPLWGRLLDRIHQPKLVIGIGGLFMICCYFLLGPAPFLPFETSLPLVVLALTLHGIGIGAELVAGFLDAVTMSIKCGFPDDMRTYSMVSSLWASAFALGAFIGPSIAGILFDSIGFRSGSMVVLCVQCLVTALNFVYCWTEGSKKTDKTAQHKYSRIDGEVHSNKTNGLHTDESSSLLYQHV